MLAVRNTHTGKAVIHRGQAGTVLAAHTAAESLKASSFVTATTEVGT